MLFTNSLAKMALWLADDSLAYWTPIEAKSSPGKAEKQSLDFGHVGERLAAHTVEYEAAVAAGVPRQADAAADADMTDGVHAGVLTAPVAQTEPDSALKPSVERGAIPSHQSLQSLLRDLLVLLVQDKLSAQNLSALLLDAQISATSAPATASLLVDVFWVVQLEIDVLLAAPSLIVAEASVTKRADAAATSETPADAAIAPKPKATAPPQLAQVALSPGLKKLASALRHLVDQGCVSRAFVLERMEPDLLEGGSFGHAGKLKTTILKANTRLNYTQLKYNMYAEESEGYAKLIEVLLQFNPLGHHHGHPQHASPTSPSKDAALEALCVSVQSLVGQFSLDPNRTFDVICDAYELRHAHVTRAADASGAGVTSTGANTATGLSASLLPVPDPSFLALLDGRLFSRDSLAQLLGFKFSQYARSKSDLNPTAAASSKSDESKPAAQPPASSGAASASAATSKPATSGSATAGSGASTPSAATAGSDAKEAAAAAGQVPAAKLPAPGSLYTIAAWLVANGCIGLRDLWEHLGPTAADAKAIAVQVATAVQEEAAGGASAIVTASGAGASALLNIQLSDRDMYDGAVAKAIPTALTTATTDAGAATGSTVSAAVGTGDPLVSTAAAAAVEAEQIHQKVGLVAGLLRCGSWSWACQAASMVMHEADTGTPSIVTTSLPVEVKLEGWYSKHARAPGKHHHHHAAGNDGEADDTPPPVDDATIRRILHPSAASSPVDLCVYPSVAKAACALTRAALNGVATAPIASVRAKLLAAIGAGPGQDPVVHQRAVAKPGASSAVGNDDSADVAMDGPAPALDHALALGMEPAVANASAASPFLQAARTLDDVPSVLGPLLDFLGPHCSNDPVLVSEILRVCKDLHGKPPATAAAAAGTGSWSTAAPTARSAMQSLLRSHILPAISLCGSNANVAFECWEVLRPLSWPQRYEIYSGLQETAPSSHPALSCAKSRATAAAKHCVKRLAAETLKQCGRLLSKLSHSNPLPVLDVLVTTIETYDNLIPYAVDALKYATPMALDVIAYVIIDRLAVPRAKTKNDGMTPADWLSSLASFTGQFYRKYSQVEIGGLLHHIVCCMTGIGRDGDGGDNPSIEKLLADLPALLLFRELISRMCGMEALPDVTDEQLDSFAGSETLRNQYLSKNLVVGPAPWTAGTATSKAPMERSKLVEANDKISSLTSYRRAITKLRDTLLNGYGGGAVAVPMFILLAQTQDLVLFGKPTFPLTVKDGFDINNDEDVDEVPIDFEASFAVRKAPLKVVGSQYDGVHTTLMLFSDLLRVHAVPTPTTYASMLPPLADLLIKYRLPPAYAWLLIRPAVRCATYPGLLDGLADTNLASGPLLAANVFAAMLKAAASAASNGDGDDNKMTDGPSTSPTPPAPSPSAAPTSASAEAVAASVSSSLRNPLSIASSAFTSSLTSLPSTLASMPVSDWGSTLSPQLYSIFWAHTLYDIGVPNEQYEKACTALKEAVMAVDTVVIPANDPRSASERDRVRNRYLDAMKRMRSDAPAQSSHVKRVIAGIASIKDKLFAPLSNKLDGINALMQHCIMPRVLLSPEDALYCARFLLLLNEVDVPAFSMARALSCCVKMVAPHLLACTETEAACLGIFMSEMLKFGSKLCDDAAFYAKNAANKVTFAKHLTDLTSRITHKEYTAYWGTNTLASLGAVVVTALSSKEHVEVKNALVMLRRLTSTFPDRLRAQKVMQHAGKLRDHDAGDIKTYAIQYHGLLQQKFSAAPPPAAKPAATSTTAAAAASSRPAAAAPSAAASAPPRDRVDAIRRPSPSRSPSSAEPAERSRPGAAAGAGSKASAPMPAGYQPPRSSPTATSMGAAGHEHSLAPLPSSSRDQYSASSSGRDGGGGGNSRMVFDGQGREMMRPIGQPAAGRGGDDRGDVRDLRDGLPRAGDRDRDRMPPPPTSSSSSGGLYGLGPDGGHRGGGGGGLLPAPRDLAMPPPGMRDARSDWAWDGREQRDLRDPQRDRGGGGDGYRQPPPASGQQQGLLQPPPGSMMAVRGDGDRRDDHLRGGGRDAGGRGGDRMDRDGGGRDRALQPPAYANHPAHGLLGSGPAPMHDSRRALLDLRDQRDARDARDSGRGGDVRDARDVRQQPLLRAPASAPLLQHPQQASDRDRPGVAAGSGDRDRDRDTERDESNRHGSKGGDRDKDRGSSKRGRDGGSGDAGGDTSSKRGRGEVDTSTSSRRDRESSRDRKDGPAVAAASSSSSGKDRDRGDSKKESSSGKRDEKDKDGKERDRKRDKERDERDGGSRKRKDRDEPASSEPAGPSSSSSGTGPRTIQMNVSSGGNNVDGRSRMDSNNNSNGGGGGPGSSSSASGGQGLPVVRGRGNAQHAASDGGPGPAAAAGFSGGPPRGGDQGRGGFGGDNGGHRGPGGRDRDSGGGGNKQHGGGGGRRR